MTQIKITADNSQALKGIEQIERALGGIQNATALASKALAVTTAALGGFAFGVKQIIDNVGAQEDLAKALGTTGRQLDYLQKSAQLAGISAGELSGAMMRLQGNIGEAFVSGSGPALDAINRLNLSVKELSQLPADQQLAKITAALKEVSNPAERAALAVDLLGKQGPRLLEVADNAARLKREAQEMGLALSDVDVRSIERAGDAMDELSFIAGGVIKKLVAELAPVIIVIAEKIKEAVQEMGGMESVIDAVIRGFKLLVQVTAALMAYIAAAKIVAIVTVFGKLALQVVAVARAMRTLGIAAAGATALATGGASAIITATAGVAGAIAAGVAAGKAMDSIFEDAKIVTAEVADEVDRIPPAIKKASDEQETLNKLKQKALEALGETVTRLQQNVQFQQDILTVGKEEAEVRKLISEEAAKLKKAGLEMTPIQEQSLRNELQMEEALKRQITLREQQGKAILEGLSATSAFGKEMEKLERLSLKFNQNMTDDEIEKAFLARAEAANAQVVQPQSGENAAILRQKATIKGIIAAEVGKYNELVALDNKYAENVENINRMIRAAQQEGNILNQNQYAALLDAKKTMEQQYYNDRIKAEEAMNNRLQQVELDRINRTLMAQKEGNAAVLSETDRALLQKVGAEERLTGIVAERINFEKKSDLDKTKFAIDNMSTVFAALGAQNKKAFEANKAFAIASAVINAYQGASKALATYPWPFGLVAAAAAVAAGFAQVSAIRSQQYQGRQLGGPVMGGQPYIVGENGPELFTPRNTGAITPNRQLGGDSGEVTVNFNIVANDTAGFDQLLSSRRGIITQIISDAMLERGQRSMI